MRINDILSKTGKKSRLFGAILFLLLGLTNSVHSQNLIKGTVYSLSNQQALSGIEVKPYQMVSDPVYTDSLGHFELSIESPTAFIQFSYAEYKSQVQFLKSGDEVKILMVDLNEYSLDDEIEIPLGKIKDKHFTGAKALVNQEDLNKQIYPSIDSRMYGMASGVRVLPTSGSPGAGSDLLIRGISTINGGTQPLYVIDGLILRNYQYDDPLASLTNNNPLADINPYDIKSVNVIKDGAQSAFYGVRGANGVVILETNMGTSGKTELTFDAYAGISSMPNELPVLNSTQYKTYFKDLNYANGMSPFEFGSTYGRVFYNNPAYPDNNNYNNNTNWQNVTTSPAWMQNYYLNLKGGDQVTTYAFSTGYLNQKGVIEGTDLQRFTINFNLIYRISDKIRFGNVVNFAYADKSIVDEGINEYSNPLFISTVKAPQFAPNVISSDGINSNRHQDQDFFGMSNPAHVLTDMENKVGVNRLMGSVYLDFDLAKNLIGHVELGIDYNRQTEKRFYPDYGMSTAENAQRYAESKVNNRFLLQGDAYLKYHKTIRNSSTFTALAGMGVYNQNLDYTYGKSINSAADYFTTLAKGDADSLSSGSIVTRMVSAYAKLNYNIHDKYLLEANVRADGSSRFGENNRYGYFPGVSAGWRISEENFLRGSDFVDELKLKIGYGLSGNDNIEDYAAYNSFMGAAYNLRGATKPVNLGNKELKWETTQQFDMGVQFMGAHHKIGAEIDVYQKQTSDLFYIRELPSFTGYSGLLDNLGDIENKGVDVNLFFRPVDRSVRWDTRLIFSVNKNSVKALPGGETTMGRYGFIGMAREGDPVGAFYGYKEVGLFDTQQEANQYTNTPGYAPFQAGDIKYEDVNKDHIIDQRDMQIIGSPHPDFYGSFLNAISFKGWTLDMNFTYAVGNEAMNTTRRELESMSNYYNQSTAVLKAWKKEGDATQTRMPRMALNDPSGNARNSSRWMEDASYLRIQMLGLKYSFQKKALAKMKLNALTFYLKAQNLYTFTNYLGYAPDFKNGYNPLLYGIDAGNIPMPRTTMLGVKIGL